VEERAAWDDDGMSKERAASAPRKSPGKGHAPAPASFLQEAVRYLPGGWRAVVEMFRTATGSTADEDLDERAGVVHVYDRLSRDEKRRLTVDRFCAMADMEGYRFLELACSTAYRLHMDVARLVLAVHTPKVLHNVVKLAASGRGGHRQQEMILKSGGILPVPGGAQVTNQYLQLPAGVVRPAGGEAAPDPDVPLLPPIEQDSLRMAEIIRASEARRLETPAAFVEDAPSG
jgi:hypothetical protein